MFNVFLSVFSDVSKEEPSVVSKPVLQPTIEPPKQKRILVVPNHQQSVMSNLSSLWKAGQLCDALISNGTVNVKVNIFFLETLSIFLNKGKSVSVILRGSARKICKYQGWEH